ncbi:FHA domain-containing protein [Ruegeria sp. HKCCD8929]|uniref:FHA domain-containing protein n=1 Tax=Ruegeria sp. HKCCD8929 TaxID=2683006 RepID=UPI001487C590|nr:FHA domain-containing protein [Ruegeria sp. HKCCD8929]
MFKYKSPLSRLLEGAGKSKENTEEEVAAPEAETAEPIADLNALRLALSGDNTAPESYDDAEELMPEAKMPEFESDEVVEAPTEETAAAPVEDAPAAKSVQDEAPDQVVTLRLTPALSVSETPEPVAEAAVALIEEMVEPETAPEEPVEVGQTTKAPAEPAAEAPAATPAPNRRDRVKTTFLGFERPDTHVQDLMETAPAAKPAAAQASFPVGWLVITNGPGCGTAITLTAGLMQIGRNDDQAIQLDFGDHGISRSNHAVVAYDHEDRKCYLGHGGKANLVRLNGGPVLSTVALSSGDSIRISETTMRFVAFCDDGFDWQDG